MSKLELLYVFLGKKEHGTDFLREKFVFNNRYRIKYLLSMILRKISI